MPKKKQPLPCFIRAGKRLAAWARKSAAGALSEHEAEQMDLLIEKYLSCGQDQVFEYALAELGEEPEAAEELLDWLELSSETMVEIGPDGKAVMARLFAVPLMFAIGSGASVPDRAPPSQIDDLAKSFRRYGLIDQYPSVFLGATLVHPEQMNIPPSRMRVILRRLLDQKGVDPELAGLSEPPPVPGEVRMALRFLLGAIVFDAEDREPFLELPEDRLQAWQKAVEQILSSESWEVHAEPPASFGEAFRMGLDSFRLIGLEVAALQAKAKDTCRAEISFRPKEEDVLFLFLDGENRLLGSYVWPILGHDDPESCLELWQEVLTQAGVEAVFQRHTVHGWPIG